MGNIKNFEAELEALLNRQSMENGSNTPDFILASYLRDCLLAYNKAVMDMRVKTTPPRLC